MAVDQIILELRAEAKQFKAELAQVRQQVSDTEKKTLQAQSNMNTGFNQMAGGLKNLAGTIGVAFGVQQILQFGKATIDAASNIAETQTKVQQLFGSSSDAINQWASTAAQGFGQSKQQALDAASTFAIFGQSAGLAGTDLVDFSSGFTELASDFASFYNTSPEDAIQAIGAALRGENEPIRRYGILLDDASLKQEALALGIIKTTKEALTPQQKVLAAQAAIYKQATPAIGDFARTSDGLANQQRILAAEFENIKTELGKEFLPIVLDVTKGMVDFLKGIDSNDIKDFINVIKGAGAALATYLTVTKGISLAQKAATLAQAAYKAVTLASAGAQALLTGNTMRATAAQKALGLATMATPWGMIAGLVAGAATALAVFGGKSKEASEGQDELKQKMDEANAAMKVQFAQLNTINETWATFSDDKNKLSAQQLRDAIQAINDELDRGSTTAERRRQYTTALQEADGNYIETQEEANKRQKEHNENLIKQRNEYEKLLKQKEKNLKGDEKELGAYEALNKRIGEYLKLLQNQAVLNNISSSNVDKYKKSVLELQAAQERLNNALKNQPIETVDSFETMNTDLDKLNTLFITAQKSAEGFRVKLDELPTAYNADEEARRRFILDMEEIASASSALGSAIGNFGNTLTEVFGKAAEDNAAFAGFLKGITILEITFSQASAIAQAIAKIAAGDPLSVITGAISLVSSITALFGGIISQIEGAEVPSPPAFAEGTPYVSLNGNPSGVDTIPAYLNEGEAVIPTDRNKKYPGLASAWINNKLDDYIMSNWVAPAIESERNKSFADNLAEAIKVSGVFDDYRLYRAISEQTSVNKSGFKKLDKVISRSVNPRLRYD